MQIKSITGGINKMQRDSIGDNTSNTNDFEVRMNVNQQTPNFYEFPAGSKNEGSCVPANSYDNQMNRFSPKVSMGQDINTMFSAPSSSNQSGQFQALNNKLKQKKQQHHQMMTQQSQNSQQMLNQRAAGGISNFMQSYNQHQIVNQQVHGGNQFV